MKRLYFCFFILFFSLVTTVHAQNGVDNEEQNPTTKNEKKVEEATEKIVDFTLPDSYQDLSFSDFLRTAEAFKIEKLEISDVINTLGDEKKVENNFDELKDLITKFSYEWRHRQWLSNWDANEVLKIRDEMQGLFDLAAYQRKSYVESVKNTEKITSTVKKAQDLFKMFRKQARSNPALKSQLGFIETAIKDTDEILATVQKNQVEYAKTYKKRSDVLDQIDVLREVIDDEVEYQQSLTFKKSHVAFYETDFLNFFNEGTQEHINYSLAKFSDYNWESFRQEKFFYLPYLLFILIFGFFLKKVKSPEGKEALFHRPFGLAFVVSLILFRVITDDIPITIEVIFWVMLLSVFQWILKSFVRNSADRRGLRALITIYGILQIVDVIGIPTILYRVMLIGLALILGIYAYLENRRCRVKKDRKTLSTLMKSLMTLCLATVVSQTMGYYQLSVLIFYGTLQSVFMVFAAWQLRFFFLKILFSVFTMLAEKGIFIFKNFKPLLVKKIRFIADILGGVVILGIFANVWGIYAKWSESIKGVWNLGVTFEDIKITLGSIITGFLILYITQFVSVVTTQYLEQSIFPKKNIPLGSAKAISGLIIYSAWVLGFFGAFSALGFELKQLATITAALSIGIGFGLQNMVNNFISGLILLFERPIKVGDMLELDNNSVGFVEKVGLRSTTMRTTSKVQLIIPNSDFVSQRVVNLTHTDKDFRISLAVGVAYGSDTELVKNTLIEVANNHKMVSENPQPQAMFMGFGDSSLDFQLWCWIKDVTHRFDVISQLHYEIDAAFRKNNITIPFPQRDLHLKTSEDILKIKNQP